MNLKARKFTIRPCVVCGYRFSDRHHIIPKSERRKGRSIVNLCPNHHRYANMVQALVRARLSLEQIEAFAREHFDEAFNTTLLRVLLIEDFKNPTTFELYRLIVGL